MPSNAKQVEQDVLALTHALKALATASGGAAVGYKVFADVLERLEPKIPAAGYSQINDELALMQRLVRGLGANAEFTQGQVQGMVKALARLADAGRLKFGQAGGKNALQNVTGQGAAAAPDPSPFADALLTPEFEQGLLGGARGIRTVQKALDRINADRVKDMRFEMSDVNNVVEDGIQKVTRWSFEIKKANQPVRRATVTINGLGKELRTTSRQLRTFGAGVARDIVEVTKWSIAIAIVYAPMKKLTDLMREAVQIESKLADVQVALVNSTTSLEQVWQQSAIVARELGVSVEGVVDGYVLATRATANILNPSERAASTVAVLRDSMLLAKLAGIDQAVAMDTLVGALRQLQQPLTQGGELLDKWVAVSKAANVSIGTLAESFAITATAAGNVGITVDKLNGIIAAVAEVTTLSATESGNAVRAFISGFQKDRSERELTRFGISVRQVNGELRSFTEIIEDIVARREVGLISDRELAKLSEIIGGGARRGPQVNAILENYGRVNDLAAVSAGANGDAAAALAIKMDTLESATTNLDNAFTELARALGGDAGFLEGAKDSVKVLTSVVDAFTGIVQVLGKATPAIIAFSAAFLALKHSVRLQDLLGQNLAQIVGRVPLAGGFLEDKALGSGGKNLQGVGSRLSGFFGKGGGAIGGAAIGLGAAALSGQSLAGSPRDQRRTGSTIGAGILGTVIAGGNPIGGVIGSAIVQATYSNFIDKETDLVGVFTRIFTESFELADTTGGGGAAEADRIAEREKELFELLGSVDIFGLFKVEDVGRLRAGIQAALGEHDLSPDEETISNYAIAIAELASGEFEAQTLTESFFQFVFGGGLSDEDKERIAAIIDEMFEEGRDAAEQEAPEREGTPFARAIVGTQEANAGIGGGVFQARRKELVQEVGRGQAGVRQLRELEALGQLFDNQLDTIYTALILGAKTTALSYEESANIIINASEEERKGIIDLSSDVGVLFNALQKLEEGGAPRLAINEKAGELFAEQRRLDEAITLTGQSQRFKAFQQPDLIDIGGETTPAVIKQLQEIVEAAREESNEFLESLTQDDAERAKVVDSWGELGFLMVEAFEVGLQGIEGVHPRILEQMVEDAGLAADEIGKLSIQTPDITGAEFKEAVATRLPGINELIKSVRREAGFAEEDLLDIEQLGFIFKDNVTDVIHADQLAIQLLLRDIKELNEDQLEGIFNIPEGVTALIPFTGQLYFSDQPIGEGVGEGFAMGTDIEAQTDTLSGDLHAIDASIQEQKFLEEDALTREQAAEAAAPEIPTDLSELGVSGIIARSGEIGVPEGTEGLELTAENIAMLTSHAPLGETIHPFAGTGDKSTRFQDDRLPTLGEWLEDVGNYFSNNLETNVENLQGSPVAQALQGAYTDFLDFFDNWTVSTTDAGVEGTGGEPVPIEFDGEFISPDDPRFEDAKQLQDMQELVRLIELQNTQGAQDSGPFGETIDFYANKLNSILETLVPSADAAGLGGVDPRSVTGTLGLENLGNVTEAFEAALPQSIPVTINTRITNPVSVLVDGRLLQQFIEERAFQDLGSATRRAGALGYVQE